MPYSWNANTGAHMMAQQIIAFAIAYMIVTTPPNPGTPSAAADGGGDAVLLARDSLVTETRADVEDSTLRTAMPPYHSGNAAVNAPFDRTAADPVQSSTASSCCSDPTTPLRPFKARVRCFRMFHVSIALGSRAVNCETQLVVAAAVIWVP